VKEIAMKKLTRIAARSQRGMTLLEIMIVLAILALVMGLVVGPRVMRMFSKSKDDIAALTVKKYAYEAFGEWSQAHPDKACPDKLEDLSQYMDSKDIKDPWGNPYKMFCGQNLPAGAKGGLAVMSSGPDGKDGTEDDIKSW
jgi:general secretion pathway protein G